MRRVAVFLLILSNLALPTQALASENWVIENFQSNITIQETGIVKIVEKIDVNFSTLSKHGITREIPYIYEDKSGKRKYSEIEVSAVKRNETEEKYTTSYTEGYVRIIIGDEDVTISGKQKYTISYKAIGILQGFDTYDELYWNVTGNSSLVTTTKASAVITLPKDGIKQVSCYQGFSESTEQCKAEVLSSKTASFVVTRSLDEREGMTIGVGYLKGLVPILEGKKPKEVTDDLFNATNLGIFLTTLVIGFFGVMLLWLKNGRDFWIRSRFSSDPNARKETKPIGGHETLVVEFTPPENLRPGEIGALLDEDVGNIEVTATIIDLANRGHLTISEEKKKWILGSTNYIFKKVNKETNGLLQYEIDLLEAVFKDGSEVKLSELRNKFYKDLSEIKKYLYQDLVDKGFFVENPSAVRTRHLIAGLAVSLIGGAFIWLGFQTIDAYFVSFGAALVLVGVATMVFSKFMPRKTAQGRQMYIRSRGYQMFVERAEKYRQQFFEKKNLFNEVLPYAIVFGVTEKFAKAFEEMGIEPEKPSWYSGSSTFNAVLFGSSMASFSNSFSSTIASTPSGSGSGGGGSSGGGFGGGGTGSW